MTGVPSPVVVAFFTSPVSRDEVLEHLVGEMAGTTGISAREVLAAVLEREGSLSSRVSDEVAMPHAMWEELSETALALGVCPSGVDWDGREPPVRLVTLMVGPARDHLSVMAAVARRLQAEGAVDAVTSAGSPREVRTLLCGSGEESAPVTVRTLTVTAATVEYAAELARVLPRNPVVVAVTNPRIMRLLGVLAESPLAERTILVGPVPPREDSPVRVIPTERFPEDGRGLATLTLLPLIATGVVTAESEVILVSGRDHQGGLDAVRLVDVARELQVPRGLSPAHLPQGVLLEVVIRALHLAAELALQGREGKPLGTIIVIGDDSRLEQHSQQMILNPFAGHPREARNILDPSLTETVKELAKIDGAFLVAGDGTIGAAGMHLSGKPDPGEMESGLGARHAAALGITAVADVLAICLSESTGTITLFYEGRRMIRR
ncbi:Phosphoenolpyruvate-dependent sugar phosphotransferase system, EIIA 2 [Alkalispirochaeta americana]|uniref:Phosphoenolpyruvate-dependent sugar phosphotransferase system, EIIA 2 n=1 Tax=Alkalispirochaeta americana TaxID=159291 RepID=A0A1N6S343_9SPIO|nr:diadenylate cyclase [Alkalispirochaeta americana]SIQ35489.1 Phosphoenolpyruvate-dependent sugar phosphotransferase system, EIIA 2 [Alkalispirochaeta americana]